MVGALVDVVVAKGGKLVGAAGLVPLPTPPGGFWPPSRYFTHVDDIQHFLGSFGFDPFVTRSKVSGNSIKQQIKFGSQVQPRPPEKK